MRLMGIVALGAALTLAFSLPMSSDAEASKRKASAGKAKMCTGTTFEGKKVNFRCKANETCCFNGLMAKGNCVPQGQICF